MWAQEKIQGGRAIWRICEVVGLASGFVKVLGPVGGRFMEVAKSKEESVIFT